MHATILIQQHTFAFPNHEVDFQLHMLSVLTVQLLKVVVCFANIVGIVDHLCLNFFLNEEFENTKGVNIICKSRKDR